MLKKKAHGEEDKLTELIRLGLANVYFFSNRPPQIKISRSIPSSLLQKDLEEINLELFKKPR